MICVFWLFCSLVMNQTTAPIYEGQVAQFRPNVLIAHNYLDGVYFKELEPGDMIRYYDGEWEDYKVTQVYETKNPDPKWVYREVFTKDLVLQTCIYKDGDLNWGRLFVVAEK